MSVGYENNRKKRTGRQTAHEIRKGKKSGQRFTEGGRPHRRERRKIAKARGGCGKGRTNRKNSED